LPKILIHTFRKEKEQRTASDAQYAKQFEEFAKQIEIQKRQGKEK